MSTEITPDHLRALFLCGFALATQQRLRKMLPGYGAAQDALNVTSAAVIDPAEAVEAVPEDPAVGIAAVISGLPRESTGEPPSGHALLNAIELSATTTPVTPVDQALQPITGYTKSILGDAKMGYPIPGRRRPVVALRNLTWRSRTIDSVHAASVNRAVPTGSTHSGTHASVGRNTHRLTDFHAFFIAEHERDRGYQRCCHRRQPSRPDSGRFAGR